MHKFQNKSRSDSGIVSSRENGNIGDAFTSSSDQIKDLILKANSVNFLDIFKKYNVRIDAINNKTVCPFPFHKGGRESTASFYFYPKTNTFWCFGCKTGTTCCDFVSNMEKINKLIAANHILNQFKTNENYLNINEDQDFEEKFMIIKSFSLNIREFISFYNDEQSLFFIEEIAQTFDKLIDKYPNLSNDALQSVIKKLNFKIKEYNSCQ